MKNHGECRDHASQRWIHAVKIEPPELPITYARHKMSWLIKCRAVQRGRMGKQCCLRNQEQDDADPGWDSQIDTEMVAYPDSAVRLMDAAVFKWGVNWVTANHSRD